MGAPCRARMSAAGACVRHHADLRLLYIYRNHATSQVQHCPSLHELRHDRACDHLAVDELQSRELFVTVLLQATRRVCRHECWSWWWCCCVGVGGVQKWWHCAGESVVVTAVVAAANVHRMKSEFENGAVSICGGVVPADEGAI